jgi:hypothetical protein
MAAQRLHPISLPEKNKLSETLAMIATPCRGAIQTCFQLNSSAGETIARSVACGLERSLSDRSDYELAKQFSAFSPCHVGEPMIAMPCDEQVISRDGPSPPCGVKLLLNRDIRIARPGKIGRSTGAGIQIRSFRAGRAGQGQGEECDRRAPPHRPSSFQK